ncbi:MAG: leucine-rich repeat protein [Bacteroidales bacterium]|nr:leucine-rich repeat protein [Bacteroidales bacterium]
MKNVFYQTEKAGGGASPQAAPRFLKMKRLLALAFALFVGMHYAEAYDFSVNIGGGRTFYFNIIDHTNRYVEVTYPGTPISPWGGYEKPINQLSIPSTVSSPTGTYTVTTIGEYAFYDCSGVYSLGIPNTVTTIGEYAFNFCSGLTSLTIPNTVTTIGAGAFSDCSSLQWVTIQNGVTTIGASAFRNTSISTVTIPSSVTSLGNYAFSNCSNLTSVWINSNAVASKDYTSVPNLRDNFGNQVKYYFLGTEVTVIGKKAFFGASLESVNMPNVTIICENAFASCWSLTSVTMPSSLTAIHERAFYECRELTSVSIPCSSLTSIGSNAFEYCNRLTSVETNDLNKWCQIAFSNATSNPLYYAHKLYLDRVLVTNLNSIGSPTAIKPYAFYGCTSITSATIPSSVTTIGHGAFQGCTGLSEMTVNSTTPPTITDNTFLGVSKTIPVFVPLQSVSLYENANGWKDFFNIIAIPTGMPYSEEFSSTTIPTGWSSYKGQLYWDSDLGTGTATLTESNTWRFGTHVFQELAFTSIGNSANQHKWLVSPAIIIDDIDNAYLTVSLGLTRASGAPLIPGKQDHQSFGIYVTDDYGATWHKLRTFANEGGDLPFDDGIPANSPARAFSLADFKGKTVRIGFYASCTDENDNHNCIFIDNFEVKQRTMDQMPTSVTVSEVAGHSAKVKWTAGSNFQMEWDVWVTNHTDISSPYITDESLEQGGILTHLITLNKEYVVEGLTPNTMYKAWVRYNDGHVTSPWTCSQYFETVPMCNEPTNIVVETTPTSVFVSWEPGQANQTSWEVSLVGSDAWDYHTNETSILINTEGMIEPGETFRVYITGYCEDGDGDITVDVSGTIQPWPTLTLNEGQSQDNNIVPITPCVLPYGASETQFIIPASQLDMMQSCVIEQISFHEGHWTNCAPWGENVWFTVRVMEVPEANFNGTQYPEDQFNEYNDNPGFTTYYHGKLRLDSEGMMHIPLGSLGFHYTNANLLVGIKQDTDDAGTEYQSDWLGCSTQNYQSMYLPVDGGDPTSKNFAPMVTFTYRPDTYQPPTNLVAQYASPREVYYTWTPRPGQDKVRIQIADNPSFTSAQSKTATGDQYTALYSTALTPGATYYVRAKTLFIDPETNETIESGWGRTVEMLVPDICDSPTNLAATEVGPFSATLAWEGDADYYDVEYRDIDEQTNQRVWACGFETANQVQNVGWTTLTNDDNNWSIENQGSGLNPNKAMVSSITGTQGKHSHWLVTGQVKLPGRICFKTSGQKNEELSVYVSTNGNVQANFEKVYTYTFPKLVTASNPVSIEVDLSDFEGQGFIAFVHEKFVSGMPVGTPPTYGVGIDDVAYWKSNLNWRSAGISNENGTMLDGLTPGHTYKARVRATCEGSYYDYSDWCYSANFTTNGNIEFDDPDVKAICVANWDSNNDNELSYAEAAAVESLGEAFKNNTEVNTFSELEYFTGLSDISDFAFYGCTNLAGVLLPQQITSIGEYAFGYCESMTGITIPNEVTQLDMSAFRGSGLYVIDIPASVSYIGILAFAECNNLEAVYLPASVTNMDANPFAYCEKLESIIVSPLNPVFDSRDNCNAIVKTETNTLWSGCKSTIIPESVTTIGHLAFGGSTSLTAITIPESVTSIDDAAFYNCYNLVSLTVLATTPPALGLQVFDNVNTANCQAWAPCEAVADYQTAEVWNAFTWTGIDCDIILPIQAYTNDTDGWYLITSPLMDDVSPEVVTNMTSNDFDLYAFDGNYEQAEWRNYKNSENNGFTMLRSGTGYLYANSNDVDLMFHGTPSHADMYSKGLNRNDETKFGNWNLVGNPFTTEATASVPDYYRINPGTRRLTISNGPVNPMEGIFVEANDNLTNIDFTKLTRGSRGERAIESPMVNIDLRNAEGRLLDRARLRMGEGNNLGKLDMLSDPNRLYFRIDGKDYAVARVNGQGEMPLHFDAAQNGTYSLNVNVEGMEMAYLHLIDNMTGEDIDLLATSTGSVAKYTFTGKPSDYASRFRLVFETGSSAEGDSFAFIDAAGNIVITNAEAGATLQVIDVTGRVVVSTDVARGVSTNGMTAGVYVLRLIDGDDVKTQKIVVE